MDLVRMGGLSVLAPLLLLALVPATSTGAAVCPTAGVPTGLQPASAAKAATLCLVNGERHARGLEPVAESAPLARAARRQARDMVERGYFAHESPEGKSPLDRIRAAGFGDPDGFTTGENLGWSEPDTDTPYAMVDAWMNSPPHRRVILLPRFRSAGIATVEGLPRKRGGPGSTYAMTFGS